MYKRGAYAFGDRTDKAAAKREEFITVGPASDQLFKQGMCKLCRIPLFGREPVKRDICGICRVIENKESD